MLIASLALLGPRLAPSELESRSMSSLTLLLPFLLFETKSEREKNRSTLTFSLASLLLRRRLAASDKHKRARHHENPASCYSARGAASERVRENSRRRGKKERTPSNSSSKKKQIQGRNRGRNAPRCTLTPAVRSWLRCVPGLVYIKGCRTRAREFASRRSLSEEGSPFNIVKKLDALAFLLIKLRTQI